MDKIVNGKEYDYYSLRRFLESLMEAEQKALMLGDDGYFYAKVRDIKLEVGQILKLAY